MAGVKRRRSRHGAARMDRTIGSDAFQTERRSATGLPPVVAAWLEPTFLANSKLLAIANLESLKLTWWFYYGTCFFT